ncbi:branched-chain amino acid ABC transporter permease [Arthrobacter mobilis]|uniref:Branched-chain amino acid ABC transporter permease n=1 Tax=Arthrobacter mobilis TaxID=2724944 RepID=A0A7X6HEY4_9MICC|nr:branched-chain amino acid ABC transporter permease [Arthrobacter mobilis]NKX55903.1 branched-chain amino acid ABC transporter permease [Arthrobacter mobilis]
MQIIAVGLIFAALAMTFDLLFGYTGLLSFGHTLWFALGLYLPAVLMVGAGAPFGTALLLALAACLLLSLIIGAVALRTSGIAFAMVTMAFAEAFLIFVERNPTKMFGGDEGITVAGSLLPQAVRGVAGIGTVYWIALVLAVTIYLLLRQSVGSRAGHVLQGLKENPLRVELLGLHTYRFRLLSFVLSSMLAVLCGFVYLLVARVAYPGIAGTDFALLIMVMVVFGGTGRLWGAALGGFLYGVANIRLGSMSTAAFGEGLPQWISGPLQEPPLYIGLAVVLMMLFAPEGLAGLIEKASSRLRARLAGSRRGRNSGAAPSGSGGTPGGDGTETALAASGQR